MGTDNIHSEQCARNATEILSSDEPNRDCFGATWKFQRRRPIDYQTVPLLDVD
jgi:hypothetical protein